MLKKAKAIVLVSLLVVFIAAAFDNATSANQELAEKILSEHDSQKLLTYLTESDEIVLRNVIYALSRNRNPNITNILKNLWDNQELDGHVVNWRLINHPAVRLMLAQALIEHGQREQQYIDYIFHLAELEDRNLEIFVVEALRELGNPKAIELLEMAVRSKDRYVSESAISGIVHNSVYGPSRVHAQLAWERIKADPNIDEALIQKYERMYAQSGRSSQSRLKGFSQGFHYSGAVIDSRIVEYLYNGEYDNAVAVLLPTAKDGDPAAQNMLGNVYSAMRPPKYGEAIRWYQLAVERNYAPAMVNLASMYFAGHGVEVNDEKAIRLLESAKVLGDERAIEMLESLK